MTEAPNAVLTVALVRAARGDVTAWRRNMMA